MIEMKLEYKELLCGTHFVAEIAHNIRENISDNITISLVSCDEESIEVSMYKLSLVIQHLLKVRHVPPLVS